MLKKDVQEKYLTDFAYLYNQFYPLFSLKIIKLMSDMCKNPNIVFYLTKHKNKIIWIRDFLDSLKMGTDKSIDNQLKSLSLIYDNDDYIDIVDSCINLLSQIFPDLANGFRCKSISEGSQSFPREGIEIGENAPEPAGEIESDNNMPKDSNQNQFFDADDIIFNIFSDQRSDNADIQNSQAQKDTRVNNESDNKEEKPLDDLEF